METLSNVDDLEALLNDLNDFDLEALDEPAVTAPVAVTATAPAPSRDAEVDLDIDLEDLELLDDPEPPAVEVAQVAEEVEEVKSEPAEKPKRTRARKAAEATQMDSELEMLLDEAAESAAVASAHDSPVSAVSPVTEAACVEDDFKPSPGLKTFINPAQLKIDLEFNQTNISTAMTRQAALFAHYSTLSAQAQFQADRADQQVDLVEAQLDQQYRDSFASAGTKITENVIKAAITKDSKYQAALTRKHEAKAIAEMVRSAADSFRHRRDMLIQVGADLREEMKGKVQTRAHPGEVALEKMRA